MATVYGIPYQGSKGKHAPRLYRAIAQRRAPGAPKRLLDPFCGGYAVSHYFGLHAWDTLPSDIDRYTVALLNAAINDTLGTLPAEWVTRARFEQARDNPDAAGMTDAEVGFIRQVWSFGNSGTSYIYGAHLEEPKRLAHHLVINQRTSERLATLSGVTVAMQKRITALPTARARRIAWTRTAKSVESPSRQPHSIAQMTDRERVERLTGLTGGLQHQVASERVTRLTPQSGPVRVQDYRDAITAATPDTTIYLDPPYANTSGYAGAGAFDHREFWNLATQAARRGNPVYVSEYTAPEQWQPVLSFTRPNTMAADSKSKSTGYHREHLFTYRGNE